ncbi:TetR/AcrR family transcriptional regulator [Pseudomonas sp. LFM046]|uniref:TetR/AcrR family transcriptional regulator n=1 Tax=Pseudomonas sp. LFM046 TaxID=1608357 RepID=UPI0009E2689F|nr:TetR/AcrR family transcriptional regulator [Pseudomonas sp. LFM046]
MSRKLRWGDASRMESVGEGRAVILKAALDAMIEDGFDSFSIDDVAMRANISRRTLYRYYGSKKELIQAVISVENSAFFEEMQRSLAEFEDDFEAYLIECVCFSVRYRDHHNGGFHHSYLAKNVSPEVSAYILENIAPMWHSLLEGPYRQYIKRLSFAPAALEDIIELISRLGLSYCLAPVEEADIRRHIRLIRLVLDAPR